MALYMGELYILRLSVIQMAKVLNFGANSLCADALDLQQRVTVAQQPIMHQRVDLGAVLG